VAEFLIHSFLLLPVDLMVMLELAHLVSTWLQLSRPAAISMVHMHLVLVLAHEGITCYCNCCGSG